MRIFQRRRGRGLGGLLRSSGGPGPELIVNGTFDSNTSGWTSSNAGFVLTAPGGVLRCTRGASINQYAYQAVSVVNGRQYQVSGLFVNRAGTSGLYGDFRVGTTISGVDLFRQFPLDAAATSVSGTFTASATTIYVTLVLRDGVSTDWIEWDNISLKAT